MVIIETSVFTRIIQHLLTDEQYRELQNYIISFPAAGKIIQGSGGIRKLRFKGSGRGKRGGTRVIYYWASSNEQIFMLYAYLKKDTEDLSKEQCNYSA